MPGVLPFPGALASMLASVLVALGPAGCGEGEPAPSPPQPRGPLAAALADVGGGGANGSLGFGWADPVLVRRAGLGPDVIADALGPNADSVVESARRLRARFGFDPLNAERFVSVGGSYAFGLRLDGVNGRGLARALLATGGRERDRAGAELVDVGDYAVVPEPLLDVGVNGLGAFDALGRHLAVLAISDRARSALLGRGERLIDEPVYRAAADCLRGAVAARMVPDKLLLSVEVGIELIAIGVRDGAEVLCAVGGDAERSAAVAEALERSLAPEARDPVTGERLGKTIAGVRVSRSAPAGVEVARAELELAADANPGYLFAAVATGSMVSLLNGEAESFLP